MHGFYSEGCLLLDLNCVSVDCDKDFICVVQKTMKSVEGVYTNPILDPPSDLISDKPLDKLKHAYPAAAHCQEAGEA